MMPTGNTLFAVVGTEDPYMPSLVAGEKQAGPILSLMAERMATRPFDILFLFYTQHTQANAFGTQQEVEQRYRECRVMLHQLPESTPEDVPFVISRLSREVRRALRLSKGRENSVCMSSGAMELRAAMFYMVAAQMLPATLLHVGSPAERLCDPTDVKEVRLDGLDGSSLRFVPPDFETQMEFVEAELPHASTSRYPELEPALKELQIHFWSAKMRRAAEGIASAANSTLPVLILGESGTGKELFAKLVHKLSDRRSRSFIPLDCGAISAELIESELFGHERGAFTDAVKEHKGAFEQADKGTLFLDEIGNLPLAAQAKLLRVLEEGEIKRLGSEQARKVDVRIVAATNANLRVAVEEGRFRRDLYYRLRVVEVSLPPLRERREEICKLALCLLERLNTGHECQRSLAKASLSRLNRHSWPGNVRELRNVLEAAVVQAGQDEIQPEDLPIDTTPSGKGYLDLLPPPSPEFPLDKLLDAVEDHQIRIALSMCGENGSQAGKLLGRSRQSINQRKRRWKS